MSGERRMKLFWNLYQQAQNSKSEKSDWRRYGTIFRRSN